MNSLGRFIAEHRMARNLSLRKLAEIANLSHTDAADLTGQEIEKVRDFINFLPNKRINSLMKI